MRKDKKLYSKMIKKYSDYTTCELKNKIKKEIVELRKECPGIYEYLKNYKSK